jgi:hypothetical protein
VTSRCPSLAQQVIELMQICQCSDVIWLKSQSLSVAARGLHEFPVQMQHGTKVQVTPRFLKVR